MDKETAAKIVNKMDTCLQILGELVRIADTHCNDGERKVVRRGIGHVLSEMQERITDPIFRLHPDLIPKGVDYAPLAGPTIEELASKLEATDVTQ